MASNSRDVACAIVFLRPTLNPTVDSQNKTQNQKPQMGTLGLGLNTRRFSAAEDLTEPLHPERLGGF